MLSDLPRVPEKRQGERPPNPSRLSQGEAACFLEVPSCWRRLIQAPWPERRRASQEQTAGDRTLGSRHLPGHRACHHPLAVPRPFPGYDLGEFRLLTALVGTGFVALVGVAFWISRIIDRRPIP